MKLHNEIKTVEIAGTPVRVGALTIGAAIEIESYLSTLKTPFERVESSPLLALMDEARRNATIDKYLQQLSFWPPDAIGALCDPSFRRSGPFMRVVVASVVRSYNPHFSDEEIARIAASTSIFDAIGLLPVFMGVSDDPKDGAGLGVADPPNESTGGAQSPS